MATSSLGLIAVVMFFIIKTADVNAASQPTPTTTSLPDFTFTCKNDTIDTINILDGKKLMFKVLKKDGFCEPTNHTYPLLQCIKDVQTQNGQKPVYLVHAAEEKKNIVGGKSLSYLKLSCEEGSVIKKALQVILTNVSATTPSSVTDFTLKSKSKTPTLSINPNSNIKIGDNLKMTIAIEGKYILRPEKCTAKPSVGSNDVVPLWARCNVSQTDVSLVDSAWNGVNTNQNSMSLTVYAFRFSNSNTVIIECEAKICPNTRKPDCSLECPGRKRRSSEIQYRPKSNSTLRKAVASFSVVSDYDGSASSSSGLFIEGIVYCVAVVVTKLATEWF